MIREGDDSDFAEFHALKKMYAKHQVELPFDPVRKAYTSPMFFDIPTRGDLVGSHVLVYGGPISVIGGTENFIIEDRIGEVVAHCHDRIVVCFPGTNFYIGWIDPEEYRVFDYVYPDGEMLN